MKESVLLAVLNFKLFFSAIVKWLIQLNANEGMYVKKIVLVLSVLTLTSCTVKTNLGGYLKSKVETEIRSSHVDVYGASEIFRYETRFLGQVETDYCQNDKFGKLPPKSKLQEILKAKAQKLGGNGIVYGQCEAVQYYSGCDKYLSCEGSVYSVTM
jgi:hypothetical protein